MITTRADITTLRAGSAGAVEQLLDHDPRTLGPYTILARLGRGGMGAVYLGEGAPGQAAALKVVKPELAGDPEFRARFAREVEAGRRVASPCVARFLDADPTAPAPWLATEYVAGPTLDRQVELEGPLAGHRLVALAAGLADALVAVHRAGLVHRDLKPSNVILAGGAPKLIDFGVARSAGSAGLTTTGSIVGSPAYMAPEQAEGRGDVGPAADVFSWAGCVVYASRGEPPFGRGESAGMLYRVVHEQADLAGVPPELLPVVEACLLKDPARRPTAAHLLEACTALAGGSAPPAPSDTGAIDRTMVQARDLRAALPPRPSAAATAAAPRSGRRRRTAVLVSVLLLVGAVAGALVLRPQPKKTVLAAQPAASRDEATTTTAPASGAPAAPGTTLATATATPDAAVTPATAPVGPAPTSAPPAPVAGPEAKAPAAGAAPVGPPAGAPTPTTVPRAGQLVVDDASNAATVRASGPGDWGQSKYATPYEGTGYRTIKAQLTGDRPFAFSFLVREGEQLERTVEARWTVGRPGEPSDRNRAVPFIVRNASGVELARVTKDQRTGHGAWNPIGRYSFTPGWNTVLVSRISDPALGQDIVADAVRLTP